ncbi:MAG: hypothetical protein L6Q68_02355 [Aquabacterium sp.]|nr:hypothetical protein [Aquabacterium sp.]
MSMSNASESNLLLLLFQNVAWEGIGDAGGLLPSVAAGSFYVRLHTSDPGEAGNGSTNEVAYTGYSPVAVPRSALGFAVAADTVSNAATVQFGECTAGTATATHFSVCLGSGIGAAILYRGTLDNARNISSGITPLFNPGAFTGVVN